MKILLSWDLIYNINHNNHNHNNLSNIYYLIDDLLHPKNLKLRAHVKECNSPIYQKYFCIFVYKYNF